MLNAVWFHLAAQLNNLVTELPCIYLKFAHVPEHSWGIVWIASPVIGLWGKIILFGECRRAWVMQDWRTRLENRIWEIQIVWIADLWESSSRNNKVAYVKSLCVDFRFEASSSTVLTLNICPALAGGLYSVIHSLTRHYSVQVPKQSRCYYWNKIEWLLGNQRATGRVVMVMTTLCFIEEIKKNLEWRTEENFFFKFNVLEYDWKKNRQKKSWILWSKKVSFPSNCAEK